MKFVDEPVEAEAAVEGVVAAEAMLVVEAVVAVEAVDLARLVSKPSQAGIKVATQRLPQRLRGVFVVPFCWFAQVVVCRSDGTFYRGDRLALVCWVAARGGRIRHLDG